MTATNTKRALLAAAILASTAKSFCLAKNGATVSPNSAAAAFVPLPESFPAGNVPLLSSSKQSWQVAVARKAFHPSLLSQLTATGTSLVRLNARRRRRYPEDENEDEDDRYYNRSGDDEMYYDDDYDDGDFDEFYDEPPRSRGRGRRRRSRIPSDDLGTAGTGSAEMQVPSPFGLRSGMRLPDSVSKAVLAGIFVLGIGTGVTIDSQINTNPKDLASRDAIDQNAPNPIVCARYGASAMAFDQRVFVSFNPFNVYVAQADVKPACVLRQSNVVQVLQQANLINDNEVRACKRNMNTWAFVGDLDDKPQISCVYQSEDAQNEFLSNPKLGIGEDVYDDDRALEALKKATGKLVKGGNGAEAAKEEGKKILEAAPTL